MSAPQQLCLASEWQEPGPPRHAAVLNRVTEVVLPHAPGLDETLLLPMLEQLSRRQPLRWVTWVGRCNLPSRGLADYPTARRQLRLLPLSGDEQVLVQTRRALAAGTSGAVIATLDRALSERELASLEQAAQQGEGHGVIVRRWS